MNYRRPLGLAALALWLAGCGSYGDDLRTICDAPSKASPPPGISPSDQGIYMATWISEHLHSREGKATFAAVATVAPADRGIMVRKEASAHGVSPCAWADWYDEQAAASAKAEAAAGTDTATVAP